MKEQLYLFINNTHENHQGQGVQLLIRLPLDWIPVPDSTHLFNQFGM